MSKQAPSTTQLLVIVGFALSCFGILLFLWITFGGPTPFKAKPYEIRIPFTEAAQLAEQSDVRISGVSVGKVQSIEVGPEGKRALATIHIEDKYGPIPERTRAILRTKTLLGETYVELTPGDSSEEPLPDGGTLATAQVAESVQLDEIFRTFDPRTRAAFQEWMRSAAIAIEGRGSDFSNALAQFGPAFDEFDRLFRLLDSQRRAVRTVFRNGAKSLRALRGRQGELAELIQSSNAVFETAAERDRDLEALFRVFPTFLDESKLTLERTRAFAENTNPLMKQLVPVAEQLSPTLISLARLAPEAKGFYEGLEAVIDRAGSGFPALRRLFRDEFPPLLRAVDPFLRNLNPFLDALRRYRRELAATMANVAAATNAVHLGATGEQLNYLRIFGPLGPETLATFPRRLSVNRSNAYAKPGWLKDLARGLPSFETRQCSGGITASLDPSTPESEAFQERTEGDPEKAKDFFERLKLFAFAGQESTATVPAPGCAQQGPFDPIFGSGPPTQYQHTFAQGRRSDRP